MFFGLHKSKFNKMSFNKIFFVYAVNNIIAATLYYFFFRLTFAPAFFSTFEQLLGPHLLLGIFWQILYHTLLTTYLLDFVISLNRFTAVAMPLRYIRLWNGKIIWVIAFIIIVPYILFWPIPFENVTVEYNSERMEYYVVFGNKPPIKWPYVTTIMGTSSLVTCVVCLFCNTYVGYKVYQNRNVIGNPDYQQDRVYFFFTMCIFASQVLNSSVQVVSKNTLESKRYFQWMLNYANPDDVWVYLRRFQFIAYDLSNLLPPWALLLMNSTLRKAIYETMFRTLENVTKPNIITIGSTSMTH